MKRLFVPLKTEHFENFKFHGKTFELRTYGKYYTEKFVYQGKPVELRKGYSGESLWGEVGEIVTGTLDEVLSEVNYKKILPNVDSLEEANREIKEIMGEREKYIAFEIVF